MKIDRYDWQFDVDIQKTRSMYNSRLKSAIDAHNQLPELVNFLDVLGIDIEKPEELATLPSNIYAYSFVPQLDVLQHADLFFTHGGMNSINEAMYYGVSMLVMPITSDQPINAQRVEDLKIGKSISKFCSAKTMYKNTMELLNDTSIKTNAEAMQRKVRADIGVSGVADNIEQMLSKYL